MSDFDGVRAGSAEGEAGETQPGWYPDQASGQLRWWDGQQWGDFQQAPGMTPVVAGQGDPRSQASMAHYFGAGLAFFTCLLGWLGPLIIYSGQGKNDPFVRDQAAEATNFQITMAIAMVVLGITIIGGILAYLAAVIFGVMGGMAASRGEYYRYPFSIKFVK